MNEIPLSPTPARLAAVFAGAHWCDVALRSDVLPKLDRHVLLHAGPPHDGEIAAPVMRAAVQAILFEGLARDAQAARALIADRKVQLLPAQDHGVATPLAQVVSASMPLAVVRGDGRSAYAPLVEGPAPALRFGTLDPEAIARLRAVADLGLRRIAQGLRSQPLALQPLIESALQAGDECHGRTVAANELLAAGLPGLADGERAALRANPGFVLPVLMATALWRLQGPSAPIVAVGGNGLKFGLRLRGDLRWCSITATPPRGVLFAGRESTPALGAIGDSAVIDFCGLGGQALELADALRADWRAVLPADLAAHRHGTVDSETGLVDPERTANSGCAPLVNLAILDQSGEAGLIGRGVYMPPAEWFRGLVTG